MTLIGKKMKFTGGLAKVSLVDWRASLLPVHPRAPKGLDNALP